MQPHRHHRSAAGLSCVPAAWTSLPAPVLPPETEETVDPAGRHRTGLARAGWHFWACSASYQPAPKSADPRTCTGRQCTHRDDQNSKTGRAAREDSQEKQRRPTHKTAPAETHRRTKPESGSPEPTSQPPHRSVAPVAPPSHRTKRITAVVPPASRSAGSSSSSDRPRARPRQPPKQPPPAMRVGGF